MRTFLCLMALLTSAMLTGASLLKIDLEATPKLLFKHADKVMHLTAYFVLTTSWLFAFMHLMNLRTKVIICSLVLLYGVLMELLQGYLTTYRQPEFLDFVANTVGVLIAFLSYRVLQNIFVKLFCRTQT